MQFGFRTSTLTAFILGCCLLNQPLAAQQQKKMRGKQLASIDGAAITESQVRAEGSEDLETLELKRLKAKATFAQDEQEILESTLERMLEEKLLASEAAKRGVTKEALTASEIGAKVQETTSEEIERFYEQNKHRINMEKEEAIPQIAKYLRKQKTAIARQQYMDKLEKEHKVIRTLEPLRFDVTAPVKWKWR